MLDHLTIFDASRHQETMNTSPNNLIGGKNTYERSIVTQNLDREAARAVHLV